MERARMKLMHTFIAFIAVNSAVSINVLEVLQL